MKNREPDLGYETGWIHEARNQTSLLEAFAAHLQLEDSLCLFYAKHVPFVEGTSRVSIAAGRVKDKKPLIEFDREGNGMRGMVCERPVQHSIRPKGKDGFLMPYYCELLERVQQDPTLEVDRFVAKAPDDHWDEFSYGSELVTHDGALMRMEEELGIPTGWQRQWLQTELVRLWTFSS
jgi:hypothetical protein